MANTPLFRLQPGKRKLATRSTHVAVLTFTAAAVFVLYVACAFFLLAGSATDDMQHKALSSSSKQHALGVWHGNRRLHMTFKHTKQLADPRAAAEALRQRWAEFWASELPSGLATLQALRDQVSMTKYQQLQKDLEPQNTAGLDVALSDTLHSLAQQTQLGPAQAWLKEQTTAQVFKALNDLQRPSDCASARKLVCMLNKGCGFACQIHHVVHCLTHAVALNRTMVLKTDPWRYSPKRNGTATWQELMEPVSSCGMHHLTTQDMRKLPAIKEGAWHEQQPEVALDIIDSVRTSLEIPSMPPDVLQLVQLFDSRPEHWWVGVLSSYILRPSELSLQRHAAYRHSNSWTSPVVGVHVRRTDKITSGEAKLHSVPEYMSHVERYCDWKLGPGWQRQQQQHARQPTDAQTSAPDAALTQLHGPKCTVYLATDQPSILEEIQTHFPHIHVITNPVALATGDTKKRNSKDGAVGIYDDTILLSSTDYLVGTFSSQVSRLAYEVSLVNGSSTHPVADPSLHYHSVDSMWYFGGMQHYEYCATHDFTVMSGQMVAAGQHVSCNAMYEFKTGLIKCSLLSETGKALGATPVHLPPALLGRCKSFVGNSYRSLLPTYMRQPEQA